MLPSINQSIHEGCIKFGNDVHLIKTTDTSSLIRCCAHKHSRHRASHPPLKHATNIPFTNNALMNYTLHLLHCLYWLKHHVCVPLIEELKITFSSSKITNLIEDIWFPSHLSAHPLQWTIALLCPYAQDHHTDPFTRV